MKIARAVVSLFALAVAAPADAQVSGTTIVSGSTPVAGTCPSGNNLFNNSGVVGCQANGGGSGTVTSVGFTGGLISVATPTTTPALTVAGTSGGIPYFNSASTWASSGVLSANALLVGGGAGVAPGSVTTGAGVLTALGAAINATTGLPNVDGAITTGNCLKWGPGIQDAGAVCGTGGSSTLTVGTTPTSGGAAGQLMFDDGSLLQETTLLKYASGLLTANLGTLNTTPTDAYLLTNTVAATVSQNQISPALHFIGQGWKTTATAGSQQVEFREYLQEKNGTSSPSAQLVFIPTINTTAVSGIGFAATLGANGPAGTFITNLDGTGNYGIDGSTAWTGIGPIATTSAFGIYTSAAVNFAFAPNKFVAGSASSIGFASTTTANQFLDTAISRCAAGIICVGSGASASVAGQIEFAGLISASTKPTSVFAGGTCAGGTLVGGATAGTATLTGACAITNTWTLSVLPSVPTGYACDAHDQTTPADLLNETSTTTTTVVFTFAGTTGATDVINYKCIGY